MQYIHYSYKADSKNSVVNGTLAHSEELMFDSEVLEGFTPLDKEDSFYWLKDAKRLRINRILPEDTNPLISDFSILGFRKKSPSYDRGKKVKAEYMCVNKDEIIVEKVFGDVVDENGLLVGLEITFNWYCEDNTIGATKTEIVKSYNPTEAEEEYEKRRRRQIRFLKAAAKAKPGFGAFVDLLFANYHTQIEAYKDPGTEDFKISMENETDPTMRSILDAVFDSETGATVQQVIIAELYT